MGALVLRGARSVARGVGCMGPLPGVRGSILSPHPRQARLFDEPQLASLCLESIDKNTADAITAEGFTDIDLGEVLRSPRTHQLPHPGRLSCPGVTPTQPVGAAGPPKRGSAEFGLRSAYLAWLVAAPSAKIL